MNENELAKRIVDELTFDEILKFAVQKLAEQFRANRAHFEFAHLDTIGDFPPPPTD
ncbi:hypothetical protein LCGC14_1266920 [marine sediment metagenome]|uniref:Uncharacterized protein n=1 Tax=marine sediment metagenome TaxID=412755 RepID=A0A0F9KZ86_9ZZZZ